MNSPTGSPPTNPLKVLGLRSGASEKELRLRYLELVKQFPPEREPERFRQIHAAFEAAKDPLIVANNLLFDSRDPAEWSEVIAEQLKTPPPLKPDFLLSLGNRETNSAPLTSADNDPLHHDESTDNATENSNG